MLCVLILYIGNGQKGYATYLYEANVSIRTRCVAANQTPWFTTHIKRLINERNNEHTRWRKFKTPELRTLFQNCRKAVVKSIEQAKKTIQRRFSSDIDTYIHNWSLQPSIYMYIIGHYNPLIRIIDLISDTTYVVCVNFIHKWWNLQFKVDS